MALLPSASGDEQTALTLWDDLGAIEALDSSTVYLSTAHALVESGMVLGTPVTQVWRTTALPYFFRSCPTPPERRSAADTSVQDARNDGLR